MKKIATIFLFVFVSAAASLSAHPHLEFYSENRQFVFRTDPAQDDTLIAGHCLGILYKIKD